MASVVIKLCEKAGIYLCSPILTLGYRVTGHNLPYNLLLELYFNVKLRADWFAMRPRCQTTDGLFARLFQDVRIAITTTSFRIGLWVRPIQQPNPTKTKNSTSNQRQICNPLIRLKFIFSFIRRLIKIIKSSKVEAISISTKRAHYNVKRFNT